MPTYEYKNIETGEIYEFKQSMRDDALTHHPGTGAAIKRIVSMPAISFKGSGFYANDSRASTASVKPGGAKSEESSGSVSPTKAPEGGAAPSSAASGATSSGSTPGAPKETPKPSPSKSSSSQGGE